LLEGIHKIFINRDVVQLRYICIFAEIVEIMKILL